MRQKINIYKDNYKIPPKRESKALFNSEENWARKTKREWNVGSSKLQLPFGISLKNNILKLVEYIKLYNKHNITKIHFEPLLQ